MMAEGSQRPKFTRGLSWWNPFQNSGPDSAFLPPTAPLTPPCQSGVEEGRVKGWGGWFRGVG